MTKKTRSHIDDLRGVSRLAVEATRSIAALVEEMHRTIAAGPAILGRPLDGIVAPLTGLVYGSIRGVAEIVGGVLDVALAQLAPLVGERIPGPEREALLAALNGVLGDYLEEAKSPLAIQMRFRSDGLPLELTREKLLEDFRNAGRKLLVLVHGSSMGDRQWNRLGHDHGAALARDLGYTPVYLHYNSGLHISTNGRAFAALLEPLIAEWPTEIAEFSIVAHSMGGIVSRSAFHYGKAAAHLWCQKLQKLVCIGSPHHGAPLERGGSWVEQLLGISRYSAPLARLGRIRSAGVTDLRFGNTLDEHWAGHDRFTHSVDLRGRLELPDGVDCYAIAGTTARKPGNRLPSDGLVPVDSALGRHKRSELTLAFPEAHQWIAFGTNHVALLSRLEVYETLRQWFSSKPS